MLFRSLERQKASLNAGTQLNEMSTNNKDMKFSLSDQTPTNKTFNNINQSQTSQQPKQNKTVDDTSPYDKVAKGSKG